MSYIIDIDGKTYVACFRPLEDDIILKPEPCVRLESEYQDLIMHYKKPGLGIVVIMITWFMILFGAAAGVILFSLITGNFDNLGFEQFDGFAIFMILIWLGIIFGALYGLLRFRRYMVRQGSAPDITKAYYRKAVLTDKYHGRNHGNQLYFEGESVEPYSIIDYEAGRVNDEYLIIYCFNDVDNLYAQFAIYADLEGREDYNRKITQMYHMD